MTLVEESSIEQLKICDVDSHVLEPPDLWTARMSKKWGEDVPHIKRTDDRDAWYIGDLRLGTAVGGQAQAGWPEPYPASPLLYEDADPGAWQPEARLGWMDQHGLHAQVLYPNMIAFHTGKLLTLDPKLRLEIIQTYNDFLSEFCSSAPDRLIPLANLPWWDIELSIAELKRCHELGHKGLNFGWQFEKCGLPPLRSADWEPLLKTVEEMGWPVNFHVAFNESFAEDQGVVAAGSQPVVDTLELTKASAEAFLSNARCISELILGRICERYPTLKFVSVESGIGYVPFLLDALDWQWNSLSTHRDHPDMLLPSEYFRRQIYATFWFDPHVGPPAELYPDNFMFETDYPHSTSLSPAPNIDIKGPRETIRDNLLHLPTDLVGKLVHGNAARVYNL
ncbi:amidohydrolase family protein [Streptomyces sp. MBT62]|uniref:amidohydrolase family protein n=1 Tax=Streptomyces sp. MBT62 TaxID=2800410 RepID=UPI001909A29E|nr:amidohydrolase family protein [Streptomyces sp. MBT62]MBK3562878.1 amidohydrolase [Streptomyces sp. MBT62]